MSSTLPKPKFRTLYLPEQVNQESMNKLTKAIIEINNSDAYLRKLYGINDIEVVKDMFKQYVMIHLKEKEMWKKLTTSYANPINNNE